MAARMETRHSGIHKRGSRYVAVLENQGPVSKQAFRTLAEAREAQSRGQGGERRPTTRLADFHRPDVGGARVSARGTGFRPQAP